MKAGNISVLVGTVAAISLAVVPENATSMRLGQVAASALTGDTGLAALLIDPQAGKVAVLLDSNHAAIRAAIVGAGGKQDAVDYVASGDVKAKVFDAVGVTPNSGVDGDTYTAFPAVDQVLVEYQRPQMTLAAALSAIEDALVNIVSPVPILIMVSQTTATISVVSYELIGDAAAAYALGNAASTKQAEFLATVPSTGNSAQFFE